MIIYGIYIYIDTYIYIYIDTYIYIYIYIYCWISGVTWRSHLSVYDMVDRCCILSVRRALELGAIALGCETLQVEVETSGALCTFPRGFIMVAWAACSSGLELQPEEVLHCTLGVAPDFWVHTIGQSCPLVCHGWHPRSIQGFDLRWPPWTVQGIQTESDFECSCLRG